MKIVKQYLIHGAIYIPTGIEFWYFNVFIKFLNKTSPIVCVTKD